MQRIYLPNTPFLDVLEISEKWLYHQLTRVLRARIDQEVIFFDGITQQDHLYSMIHINKNSVSFKKQRIIQKTAELHINLALYQGFPNKLSKFETIVQKCGEIGYSKIIFFESDRSQKLVISDNKKERLNKIIIEAIELCGGNIIPEIEYRDKIWNLEAGESFICHTQGKDSLWLSDIKTSGNINIIVWPEGGFSPEEIESISAQKIYFWERILRCETVWEVVWFYLSQKG